MTKNRPAGNFGTSRVSYLKPTAGSPDGYAMLQSDRDLMLAFQAGDEFAFVSLYNRYRNQVYGFCLKMLLDEDLAQDVLQETFMRVYENRQRLSNAASFKTWLFTIARNQSLNQLRRASRRVDLDESAPPDPRAADGGLPISRLERSERIDLVNRYLKKLKPDYREVIVLREYQNLSYDEIAAVTRTNVSTVKSRLFKARRKLASFLYPYLGGDDGAAVRPPDRMQAARLGPS